MLGLITRKEFHRRYFPAFETLRERKGKLISVAKLLKECTMDAPFRNHNYMFNTNPGMRRKLLPLDEWQDLPLQETTVGILQAMPEIKTEGERMDAILKELLEGTYAPVPISVDIDNTSIFYVEDGFHRIRAAAHLGWKRIRCNVRYGHFNLDDEIQLNKLPKLLEMLDQMFPNYIDSKRLQKFLKEEADPKKLEQTGINY